MRGQVRIKPFTEDPLALGDYGPLTDASGKRTFEIEDVRETKTTVVATLKGVNDRAAAGALNGTLLHVRRDQLPDDEDDDSFYHADLLGLKAYLKDGREFGTVKALHDFGAGDLLEIDPKEAGKTIFVPFTRAAVPTIDVRAGTLIVDPPREIEIDYDPEEQPE